MRYKQKQATSGRLPVFVIRQALQLLTKSSWRQRAHQWTHHRYILFTSWQALAHQVVWSNGKVALLQSYIGTETIEERQLEIRRLAQCTVRTDFYAVTTEDAAIKREGIAFQGALGHHQ